MEETETESPYDPFAIEAPERTFQHLRRLRAKAPVVTLAEGMHYVTSYEEARQVLRDAEHFSNALGFRAPGVEVPAEDRMLGEQDAPQHTRVRRVVISAFNPAAIKGEVGFVRERAHATSGTAAPPPARSIWSRPSRIPCPTTRRCTCSGFPWTTRRRSRSGARR